MPKTCANHPGQPSVTMCHQCHTSLCKTCTMIVPHGSFCSSECSVVFREFKQKMASGKIRKTGAGMKAVGFFLAVIFLMLVVHIAARGGVGLAMKVDLIGRVIGYGSMPGGGEPW